MVRRLLARVHASDWRVISAAATVAACTFTAKLAQVGRDVLIAHQFGTSDAVDSFVLSLVVPYFAMTIASGSVEGAFLPSYMELRHRGDSEAAQRLLSTVVLLVVVLFTATALLMALLLPFVLPWFARGFPAHKMQVTLHLSYWMLPAFVASGLTALWSTVLNTHQIFARPALASMAPPVSAVIFLVSARSQGTVFPVIAGTVFGYFVEAGFNAVALHRKGISPLPRWYGITPAVRHVLRQCLPRATGGLVMGMNAVVDQGMAARLAAGSVASLGYGAKLANFTAGVGTLSVTAAIFPHFTRLTAAHQWNELARSIRTYVVILLAITIPATALAITFSEPMARLVFQRGAFTAADTLHVARIQSLYLLQIPVLLTAVVFTRFITAISANRFLLWISVLNVVTNTVGDYVLSRLLGTAGIALATSVTYTISFTFLGLYTYRRLRSARAEERARRPDPAATPIPLPQFAEEAGGK